MPSHTTKKALPQKETDTIQTKTLALSQELQNLTTAQLAAHWDEQIDTLTKTLEEQLTLYKTISAQIPEVQKTLNLSQKQTRNLTEKMKENHAQIRLLATENQCLMGKLEETKEAFDHLLENNFSPEKNAEKNTACREIEQRHFNNVLAINHLNIQQKELLPQRISNERNKTQQVEHLETLLQQAAEAKKNHQQAHITLNRIITEQIHTQNRIDSLKKRITQLQENQYKLT